MVSGQGVDMSDEYIKGDNLLPWAPFHSALTEHDKAAIAELCKAQSTSPEKARARIAKMLNKKAAQSAIAVGRRWDATHNRWI